MKENPNAIPTYSSTNLPLLEVDLFSVSDYTPTEIRRIIESKNKELANQFGEEIRDSLDSIMKECPVQSFLDSQLVISEEIFPEKKVNEFLVKNVFPGSKIEDIKLNEIYYRKVIEDLFDTLPQGKNNKGQFPQILRVENGGSKKYTIQDLIKIISIPDDSIKDEKYANYILEFQLATKFILSVIQSRYLLDKKMLEYEKPMINFYKTIDSIFQQLSPNYSDSNFTSYIRNNDRLEFRKNITENEKISPRYAFNGPFRFLSKRKKSKDGNLKVKKKFEGEQSDYEKPNFQVNSISIRLKNVVKLLTNTIGDKKVYEDLVQNNITKGDVIGIKILTSSMTDTYNCINTIIPELENKYAIPKNNRRTNLIDLNDAGSPKFDDRMKRLLDIEKYVTDIGLKEELENIKRNKEIPHFKNYAVYERAVEAFYKGLKNSITEYLAHGDQEKYNKDKENFKNISLSLKRDRTNFLAASENELENSILKIREAHITDTPPGSRIVKPSGEIAHDAKETMREIYELLGGNGQINYGEKDANKHSGDFYISINYKIEIAPKKYIELVIIPEWLDVFLEAAEPHLEYDKKKLHAITVDMRKNIMPIFEYLNNQNNSH